MAAKSMLPNCSIYTGRPSYISINYLFLLTITLPYFIGLVVVLGVVLENFGLLLVVEGASEVVEVCFFAPLFAIDEPNKI